MLWNQKEVFVGYSLQKFNEVCNVLSDNKIKYKYKIVNHNSEGISSGRVRSGTLGANMDYSITYYVYVHKKDFETACSVLNLK